MTDDFIKYRDFYEKDTAAEFIQVLQLHRIAYETEEFRDSLGPVYGDKMLETGTRVKIRKGDFEKVDEILIADAKQQVGTAGKDHYLYSFTDEELYDVLAKPDEWNAFDYQLSKNILEQRGKAVTEDMLNNLKTKRLEHLAEPEPSQTIVVVLGYVFALLGGLLGIFIGWHLMSSKKVLPNGERRYNYRKDDRKHGTWIFFIGIIIFPIAFYLRFFVN